MKTALKSLLVLSLVAVIALPVLADDEAPKKKKAKPAAKAEAKPKAKAQARAGARQVDAMMKKLKAVELSEEQQGQLKEIAAEFKPKFQAAQAKVREVMGGKELAEKRQAAAKKARDAGLKGKALQEAIAKELDLPAETQEAMQQAQAGMREVQQAFTAAVRKVLTDEQIEKAGLPKARKAGAAKKGQAAKKAKLPGDPKSATAEKKID